MNDALPGSDLVEAGLQDLRAGRETIAALLVATLFSAIEDQIYRYPSLDRQAFRRAVERVVEHAAG